MFEPSKPSATALAATGLGLALAALVTLPMQAVAHGDHDAATAAATPAATPAPTPASVDGSANLTVVRDAETGLLRAPTADELSAMQLRAAKSQSPRVAPAVPMQKYHSSGARGARMTDDFMSFAVAVRKADGSVGTQCFETKEAAEAALSTPLARPQAAAKMATE
jgi:hypothetical protein